MDYLTLQEEIDSAVVCAVSNADFQIVTTATAA